MGLEVGRCEDDGSRDIQNTTANGSRLVTALGSGAPCDILMRLGDGCTPPSLLVTHSSR